MGGRTSSADRAGYSRPEWVFLVAILLAVLSVAGPGWMVWRRNQRLHWAQTDLAVLVQACRRYYAEYGTWPTARGGGREDVRFGFEVANREVLNVLRAVDGEGNEEHRVNPRRIVFIEALAYEPGMSGLDEDGDFLDPWGTPYQIILDANLDNACRVPNTIYNNFIGEGMIAWSAGPDRISDNADDILSWRIVPRIEMEIIR